MTELSVEFCSGRYEPASVIGDTQDHERCSSKILNCPTFVQRAKDFTPKTFRIYKTLPFP